MAVSVRIEDEAFSDIRVRLLAQLAGYANEFEALGRLSHLWRACTQLGRHDLPDGMVSLVMGPGGVDALIGSELGERVGDLVRIKGTRGRIEWLAEKRETSAAGGRARAAAASRAGGKFAKSDSQIAESAALTPADQHSTSTLPAGAGGAPPALTSAPAPAPAPAQRSEPNTTPTPTALSASLREPDVLDSPQQTALATRDAHRDLARAGPAHAAVLEVFAAYRRHHPRAHPAPKPTSKETRLIKARLAEGHTVEDLVAAVDGCHASAWHMGDNDRGRPYNSLELIVRDASKVQFFAELARAGPPRPALAQLPRRDRELAAVMAATTETGGRLFDFMSDENIHRAAEQARRQAGKT